MAASPAAADTSASTANALTACVGGNLTAGGCTNAVVAVTTGTCAAASPGSASGTCTTGTTTGNLTSLVAASVLTQSATAAGGTSAACAGLSGSGGGAVTVGPSGQCVAPTNPSATGVVLVGGLVTANAVYATCSATGSTLTGSSTLLGLGVGTTGAAGSLLGLLGTLGTITFTGSLTPVGNAPSHVVVSLGATPILTLDLNTQDTTTVPGQITVTALDLKLLPALGTLNPILLGTILATLGLGGGTLAEVRIGQVTCGPNAITVVVPTIPLKGAPIAIAIAILSAYVGWRFWWTPRRRRAEGISA